MTIHTTAYDTRACHGFAMEKTIEGINYANVSHYLKREGDILLIEGSDSAEDAIPAFAHPLKYYPKNSDSGHVGHAEEITKIVIDVRPFGKYDSNQAQFNIRNRSEYNVAVCRAKLNYIWITKQPTILRDVSPLGMSLFASWISEALSKRFALDPLEQFKLSILAAVYYNSLFTNETELNEMEVIKMTNAVSRNLRASAKDVMEVIDQCSVVSNIDDFCKKAHVVSGSVRLQDLNVGLLYSILGGTWFGANAKEMIAVALEHPPTWLTIVLTAYNDRSYKNSTITKLVERGNSNANAASYSQSILSLLDHKNN